MKMNLASKVASKYMGTIVQSDSQRMEHLEIEVNPLNDLLIKVKFKLNGSDIMFRAVLSEQEEDLHILIQDRITSGYILSGLSGFLYDKAQVHGGFLSKLNSFYFHIFLEYFNGTGHEIYFLGEKDAPHTSAGVSCVKFDHFLD